VTSRIQRQLLPMEGGSDRASRTRVFASSTRNGALGGCSEIERRTTREIEADSVRFAEEQQVPGGGIPVYLSVGDRLKIRIPARYRPPVCSSRKAPSCFLFCNLRRRQDRFQLQPGR
jgi:hypothetical protein